MKKFMFGSFALLLIVFLTFTHSLLFGWPWDPKDDDESKDPEIVIDYPFSQERLLSHVKVDIPSSGNIVKTSDYTFILNPVVRKPFSSFVGKDDILSLKVDFDFCSEVDKIPSLCKVEDREGFEYQSSEINKIQISYKRFLYLVYFKGSNVFLIIHHTTAKPAIAQWVVAHEFFYLQNKYLKCLPDVCPDPYLTFCD